MHLLLLLCILVIVTYIRKALGIYAGPGDLYVESIRHKHRVRRFVHRKTWIGALERVIRTLKAQA